MLCNIVRFRMVNCDKQKSKYSRNKYYIPVVGLGMYILCGHGVLGGKSSACRFQVVRTSILV